MNRYTNLFIFVLAVASCFVNIHAAAAPIKDIKPGTQVMISGGRYDCTEGLVMETTHASHCSCGICSVKVRLIFADGSTKDVIVPSHMLRIARS